MVKEPDKVTVGFKGLKNTFVLLIVSLIALCLGHFLFDRRDSDQTELKEVNTIIEQDNASPDPMPTRHPVRYKHIRTEINDNKQEINVLEIDLGTGRVKIEPALSFDRMFGFEKLSVIASRSKPYAAVNAGFFYEYGDPSGMVVINGRIFTKSTGEYPVFIVRDNKAELKQIHSEIWLFHNGHRINIQDINRIGKPGDVILYTPEFGTKNRAGIPNTSIVVKKNRVTEVIKTVSPTVIPEDGMILTFFEPYKYDFGNFPFAVGDNMKTVYEPEITSGMQAYECGSWIVKEGKSVAPVKDEWVGLLTNRDPRTVIGIKKDGIVVVMTVDGRQPNHSIGVSSQEMADFLIEYGVEDAAMLDGGASTEMIVGDEIVNKTSFKGKERPLGGALVIKILE